MVRQGFRNLSAGDQQKVIAAAIEEFSTKDFESASMNQIIQNAGISKGSMYHYFVNKEDLYLYLIELAMAEKKEYLSTALTQMNRPYQNLRFFEILKLQLDSSIAFAYDNPDYFYLGLQIQKMPESPLKQKIWGRMQSEFDAYMDAMIKSALLTGEIDDNYDLDFVKRLIKFVLLNFTEIYDDLDSLRKLSLPKLQLEMEQLVNFLQYGLKPKK